MFVGLSAFFFIGAFGEAALFLDFVGVGEDWCDEPLPLALGVEDLGEETYFGDEALGEENVTFFAPVVEVLDLFCGPAGPLPLFLFIATCMDTGRKK